MTELLKEELILLIDHTYDIINQLIAKLKNLFLKFFNIGYYHE